MPITFVNIPRYVPPEVYERAAERVTERLRQIDGIVSVYQIGHVGSPGISDIDFLVVCEDNAVVTCNPLNWLSDEERYLFTHSLFGACRRDFHQAQRYTFYHNYILRWGEELSPGESDLAAGEVIRMKHQIALEFLVANYISQTVDKAYKLTSVRNLFLSVKALRYDMEYLGVDDGVLYELIHQLIAWREAWFEQPIADEALRGWFEAFHAALLSFLTTTFERQRLFLPAWTTPRYARHIRLEKSDKLACLRKGMVLPLGRRSLGEKYAKLLNRFNRFVFSIPATDRGSEVMQDRFLFLKSMKRYNATHLPSLAPLGSVLASRVAA